jgi:hypothetical protein
MIPFHPAGGPTTGDLSGFAASIRIQFGRFD